MLTETSAVGGRRIRCAFVLPSFTGGGAQKVLLTFLNNIDRDRYAPSLVVFENSGPWSGMVRTDVPVKVLGVPRLSRSLFRLRRELKQLQPDVVVSTLGYVNLGVLTLKPFLPGVRFVVREANTPHRAASGGLKKALFRAAYATLYPRADKVIAPTRAIAVELSRDFAIPEDRIRVVTNPVDVAALRALATPARRAAGNGPRFVAVGRLWAQKGYDRLLDLLAAGPADIHVTILGDGPERARLEAKRQALGLVSRVAMPGFDPNPAAWLAGADALILPSRWEGLPNVALEALACGTPVITTDEVEGISEVAEHAPAGAVTIVPFGSRFTQAMLAVTPCPLGGERPALLPKSQELAAAVRDFEAVLNACL